MMRKICFVLILSLAAVALAQDGSSTEGPVIPDVSPSTPRPPPTPPPTTEAPTTEATTTPKPTTAPPAPTTEPTTPSTTTTKATTTPEPTTPTTTTTHRTTTLPPVAPTPPPFPKNVGNWAVTEAKSPCIMVKGALQLHVNLNQTNSSELVIDVPSSTLEHVSVSGKCKSEDQTLIINWWSTTATPDASKRNNTLTLKFSKLQDEQYGLMSVKYHYAHDKHIEIVGPFFATSLKHSFLCKASQRVQTDKGVSYMLTQDLQFEAFREDDVEIEGEAQFSSADECKADNRKSTGVVLGIAVGIGLLIVLVISLGIYLFKRCRRGGYQPLETDTHS